MRVLFTSVAGGPHLFPLVPLAWACRAAGHDVRIACAPSAADSVVHTGLPATLVGSGMRLTAHELRELITAVHTRGPWPQRALVECLGRYLVTAAEAMVDDLITYCAQWRPDLIVHDALTYAGPVVAEALAIPNVRHILGAGSRFALPGTEPLPEYARMFDRFGARVRIDPTATIDLTPPSLRSPLAAVSGQDMRYIPYGGPGIAPRWLVAERDRPRICLTCGHRTPDSIGGTAYRVVLDAITATEVEIIVVTSGELGQLPRNVLAAASVPLQFVVPHCDAIIQHGGDDTTLTAAVAGIPQLVITCKPDTEIAAGRLASTGAGTHLRWQDLRASAEREDLIRAAVNSLLDTPAREAAGRLRAEIERQPPPSAVVTHLEKLAAHQVCNTVDYLGFLRPYPIPS